LICRFNSDSAAYLIVKVTAPTPFSPLGIHNATDMDAILMIPPGQVSAQNALGSHAHAIE
jgi:hypothetical protein